MSLFKVILLLGAISLPLSFNQEICSSVQLLVLKHQWWQKREVCLQLFSRFCLFVTFFTHWLFVSFDFCKIWWWYWIYYSQSWLYWEKAKDNSIEFTKEYIIDVEKHRIYQMKSEDGTGSRHPSWRCGIVTPPISFGSKVVA